MQHGQSAYRGFTLIELLIVVAIIAILAAIAVPNFLEAQVRSKVSRVKADLRSTAVAVESYRVDNNAYAFYPYSGEDPYAVFLPYLGFTPPLFTTPVAYLSSLPNEPFDFGKIVYSTNVPTPNPLRLLNYETRDQYNAQAGNLWDFINKGPGPAVTWVLLSIGPDLRTFVNEGGVVTPPHHNVPEYFVDADPRIGAQGWYDPTNGTVSTGDIVYYGPGGRFDFPKIKR